VPSCTIRHFSSGDRSTRGFFRQAYRIYRIDLEDVAVTTDWNVYRLKFKILSPQDDNEIGQIEGIAEWVSGCLKAAISAGQPCLAAMDGDRVAGFNLIRLDHASLVLVNLTFRLHPGCAWSEHIAVRREYRRSGLGTQLRLRIFEELKRRGIRRLYGGTLVTNTASLSLARSVGFTEIADVHYRKIFSAEKWRYERVREPRPMRADHCIAEVAEGTGTCKSSSKKSSATAR